MAEMTEKENELLKDLKGRFLRDLKAHKEWIKEKRLWSKFYDGEQWSQEEIQALNARNQPDTVINRIKPKIDSIIGMQTGLKVNTKAFDRGTQDFETAKFISEALRQVEYLNDFDQTESEAFADQIIDGRGWYDVDIAWDGLEADPKVTRVDNEDIIADCDGRQADLSDHKQNHKTVWTSLEDAKALFPHEKETFDNCFYLPQVPSIDDSTDEHTQVKGDQYKSGEQDTADYLEFVDKKLKRVRLVTTHYRTPFRRTFVTAKGLGVQEITDLPKSEVDKILETFENAVKWDQLGHRLHAATYCWNKLLEHKEDIKPYDKDGKFNRVFVPGFRSRIKDKPWLDYGLVRQMVDPQREVNKRRSKMLHILNTNKIRFEEGAVDDIDKARAEEAKPDGVIPLRVGALSGTAPKYVVETRTDLAASQFQMLQEAKGEIDSVGIKGELEGISEATSGRDFQLRQQQATQSMRQLFANLRGARRRVFMLVLDIIQQHWTSERLVRITDDPEAGAIVLNQVLTDPATGEKQVLNNVSLGKYDLIIEESPETVTLQGETFQTLASLAEKGAPIPMDMLIEASPIPNKKRLLERMQQQQAQMAQQAAMAGQPVG